MPQDDEILAASEPKSGTKWATVTFGIIGIFASGFGAGYLTSGTVEALGTIQPHKSKIDPSDFPSSYAKNDAVPNATLAWFPDNNKIDWFISVRPGLVTIPIQIQNENETENRRILFHYLSPGNSPQLVAILYVKSGQSVRINLPKADYRLDVASTPNSMPWTIAAREIAHPKFNLPMKDIPSDVSPEIRMFVGAEGDVRVPKSSKVRESPTPKMLSSTPKNKTIDEYSDLVSEAEPETSMNEEE